MPPYPSDDSGFSKREEKRTQYQTNRLRRLLAYHSSCLVKKSNHTQRFHSNAITVTVKETCQICVLTSQILSRLTKASTRHGFAHSPSSSVMRSFMRVAVCFVYQRAEPIWRQTASFHMCSLHHQPRFVASEDLRSDFRRTDAMTSKFSGKKSGSFRCYWEFRTL